MSPSFRFAPLVLLQLISLPTYSVAYTWVFNATPQQCSNVSITITGNGGKPPYHVLIIPFGPTPLPNNTEVRKIIDHAFEGNSNTASFPINYPANSQFVAVVSDSTGFGTGGTSVAAQVTTSGDSSCFNPSTQTSPLFVFSVVPLNQIVQCQPTRIWWDNSTVKGIPNFLGVIPGGQSFSIPESSITDVSSEGSGFSWTPSLRGGTTLMIIGGDNRGNGSGGSAFFVVGNGPANDGSCLSNNSPSSTPGSPAGGAYPTSLSGGTSGGGSNGGGTNIGAIIGGVIGGVAIVVIAALLLYYLRRRERQRRRQKERPVDLLNAEEDEEDRAPVSNGAAGSRAAENDLLEYYRPEPYLVAESDTRTDALSSAGWRTPGRESRRLSGVTNLSGHEMSQLGFGFAEPSTTSSAGRKGPPPRQMRAVNIIQHEDAGPSEPRLSAGEESETIELPPAYTNIKASS